METHLLLVFLSLLAAATHQATVPSYEVEVYFVVDRRVVDRYVAEQSGGGETAAVSSMNADIDYFITELNGLYASLEEKGFNIRILKKQLDVLDTNLFASTADVSPGLKAFDAWLLSTGAHANIGYDAAILWTGSELVSDGDPGVAGYAHVAEICQSVNSSGIVEFDMTYLLTVTTAHELGHIMGASHDSDITGYIMIPTSSSAEANRWKFSLCTKEAFAASMSKLSPNCLLSTSAGSSAPTAEVTEALEDPDTICRRAEDSQSSFMCKSPGFYEDAAPHGDTVCKRIWCRDSESTYCSSAFPSDGIICGTNKRCNDGVCEDHPDSESAAVEDSCIWGDQASIRFTTNQGLYEGDCPGFIDLLGKSVCKQESVSGPCCKTCGDLHTGIEGCEYGDDYGSCNSYTQAQICDTYSDICCEFCQGYRKKRSAGSSGSDNGPVPDIHTRSVKVKDDLQAKPEAPSKGNSGPHEEA